MPVVPDEDAGRRHTAIVHRERPALARLEWPWHSHANAVILVLKHQRLTGGGHASDGHALPALGRRGRTVAPARRLGARIGEPARQRAATRLVAELAEIQLDGGDARGDELHLNR